jgi:bifunctional DNA-binding transcriptional regulator/antitoxin component of YhaV-PrlF toxin-antitoxin module
MKTFESTLLDLDSNLWGHYFPVPPAISDFFKKEDIQRLICTINGAVKIHCALTPRGDGTYFITVNKETRKRLKLKVGDTVQLQLEEDTSKYGMPVPEEFSELIKFEPEADKYFHALTPGKQRSLLYWIGQPKTSNPRLKRALALVEHLKANEGKLDFKMLHQLVKEIEV